MMRFATSIAVTCYLCMVANAPAQSCTDSDASPSNAGNNPSTRGIVTVAALTSPQTTYVDTCDPLGVSVKEYFCAGKGAVGSQVHRGLYGCLDGALVEPSMELPGCFTIFTLSFEFVPDVESVNWIRIARVEQQIAPLWILAARTSKERNKGDLQILVRDSSLNTIATLYEQIDPMYHDTSSPTLLALGHSRVILPFYPAARSVLFRAFGKEISYSLTAASKRCGRLPIPLGLSGVEGRDVCVAGTVKRAINSSLFTCIPENRGREGQQSTRGS